MKFKPGYSVQAATIFNGKLTWEDGDVSDHIGEHVYVTIDGRSEPYVFDESRVRYTHAPFYYEFSSYHYQEGSTDTIVVSDEPLTYEELEDKFIRLLVAVAKRDRYSRTFGDLKCGISDIELRAEGLRTIDTDYGVSVLKYHMAAPTYNEKDIEHKLSQALFAEGLHLPPKPIKNHCDKCGK